MATDPRFPRHRSLWQQVQEQMPVTGLAHDHQHVLRVYSWCLALAPEAQVDGDLAGAAGLLHDLVQPAKESAERSQGGDKSAVACLPLLDESGYSTTEQAALQEALCTSSWSSGQAALSDLGRVLQDADRLDAIGVIGFARCMATAQEMAGRGNEGALWDQADLLAEERPLDDKRWALDHLERKLLKLAGGMHYPSAQQEGQRRHQTLLLLRETLSAEIRSSDNIS
jgi:uncharacterized protein